MDVKLLDIFTRVCQHELTKTISELTVLSDIIAEPGFKLGKPGEYSNQQQQFLRPIIDIFALFHDHMDEIEKIFNSPAGEEQGQNIHNLLQKIKKEKIQQEVM